MILGDILQSLGRSGTGRGLAEIISGAGGEAEAASLSAAAGQREDRRGSKLRIRRGLKVTRHRHENETRRWTVVAERRGRTDHHPWAEGEPHPERMNQSRHADRAPVRQKVVL